MIPTSIRWFSRKEAIIIIIINEKYPAAICVLTISGVIIGWNPFETEKWSAYWVRANSSNAAAPK